MNQDNEERKVPRYEQRSTKIKKKGKYAGMNRDQEERKVSRYELVALIPAAFPRVWICERKKESMSFTGLENSK